MTTLTLQDIHDNSRIALAKSKQTRKVLLAMVYEKIGYRAPKTVSMKELREILNQ